MKVLPTDSIVSVLLPPFLSRTMTVVRGRTMVAGPWTTQRPLLVLRYVISVLMSALSHASWRSASRNADGSRTVDIGNDVDAPGTMPHPTDRHPTLDTTGVYR